MKKYKISKEGSKKFLSTVLAFELLFSAIGLSSCTKKEETNVSAENTDESSTSIDDVISKINELGLDLDEKTITDASIVLLLSEIAKRDEDGKISSSALEAYKNTFSTDAVLENFDTFLSRIENKMLEENFISVADILPSELAQDKVILKDIEGLALTALKNKDNKDVVVAKFNEIYRLFVEEKEVNGFKVRDLNYAIRAVAYSYAREVAYLASNYITDEEYEKIDKRTNDQNNRAELVILLSILENEFTEVSNSEILTTFNTKYESLNDDLLARISADTHTQRNLVNYLNLEYIFDSLSTKDKNAVLGTYDESDVKEVIDLICAITKYNAEEYKTTKSVDSFIKLSSYIVDGEEEEFVALDYTTKACSVILNSIDSYNSYDALSRNEYFRMLCAFSVEQETFKYGDNQEMHFNWQSMSDGVKFAIFGMINYTFSKIDSKINSNGVITSYNEVASDMLFREVQFIQDTLDECQKLEKSEYVKVK